MDIDPRGHHYIEGDHWGRKVRSSTILIASPLVLALGLPLAPLAHAAGGFSPYPSEQLPTALELQTPNYHPIAPGSHQLFGEWRKPHWLRRKAPAVPVDPSAASIK